MLRAFFFSVGVTVTLWGASFLLIDKVVLNMEDPVPTRRGFRGLFRGVGMTQKKTLDPPDWAAFSMLSLGAVTMLYSVALPKKSGD